MTEVYNGIVEVLKNDPTGLPGCRSRTGSTRTPPGGTPSSPGWSPGRLILVLMPFVPESRVWAERKRAGTLGRPSFGELFAPGLLRTTLVTTGLSALRLRGGVRGAAARPARSWSPGCRTIDEEKKEAPARVKAAQEKLNAAATGYRGAEAAAEEELTAGQGAWSSQAIKEKRGNIQRWQEIGGLTGRSSWRRPARLRPQPACSCSCSSCRAWSLFPLTYFQLIEGEYTAVRVAVFFCGLLTVGQFSYISEYLPKVFPVHLRGTGGGFATNVGGRMLGTMAATLNTELLAPLFEGDNPAKVATAAAVIGGAVYLIALVLSFWMPAPKADEPVPPRDLPRAKRSSLSSAMRRTRR